jgi:hypothetical protein
MELTLYSKLEIHYYFNDDSHSMDAIVRNDCERELLWMFNHIIKDLGLEISLETEAYREGGLKEVWKFLGKNSAQLAFLVSVLTLILSRVPLENSKLTEAQIQNLNIDTEIKKEQLKAIRNLKDTSSHKALIKQTINTLKSDYKVNWHKSNFYRKLTSYSKVTQVSTRSVNRISDNGLENIVTRKDEATIDIISPVLKDGTYSWKGIYRKQVISFEMKDESFKKSVINNETEINNGTAIKCVIIQFRKLDDSGEIVITKRHVVIVKEILSDSTFVPTPQGLKYDKTKKELEAQLNLDLK